MNVEDFYISLKKKCEYCGGSGILLTASGYEAECFCGGTGYKSIEVNLKEFLKEFIDIIKEELNGY